MMEEKDILDEISGDHSGSDRGTSTTNDHGIHLPVYLAYLSLGFRVISTTIIVLMAGWIFVTIMTTRSLHKIHNYYVANLMAVDMIYTPIRLSVAGMMMIGYLTGMGDSIGCNVYHFLHFPIIVIVSTYMMISIDKVIAVTLPLRHREIMKPRVVFGIITTIWVLAVVVFTNYLFNPDGFNKLAQFNACFSNNASTSLTISVTHILSGFLACLFTAILNIYLTIKAYQVHKKIQEESELSGGDSRDNEQLKALKKKEATIKKHLKPMITLLVIVLGSSSIGLLFPILYITAATVESPKIYEDLVHYVVTPNIELISLLLHPFVYGLYFTQIREPMMRLLKRITRTCKCKSATVAPESQRRITWLNPN